MEILDDRFLKLSDISRRGRSYLMREPLIDLYGRPLDPGPESRIWNFKFQNSITAGILVLYR